MTNTLYCAFAFLEQRLSLMNNQKFNVDIVYSHWKNKLPVLKISFLYTKHFYNITKVKPMLWLVS